MTAKSSNATVPTVPAAPPNPSVSPSTPPTPNARIFSPLSVALIVLALGVIIAMLGLGLTLLDQISEIEDNQETSEILVDFSERPYTSVQRDTLRLAVLIEDEASEINDVRNLRAVITNHMTRLTSPTQVRVRTDAVNARTVALLSVWASETQLAITDYINSSPRDEAERAEVIAALERFEQELDSISRQNEQDRQARAETLDSSTLDVLDSMSNILIGLGVTIVLLILFGAGVTATISRSTQQVIRLNNVLDQRVRERTRDLETATGVSQQVIRVLEIDELVERVADETVKQYAFDAVIVSLLNAEDQYLDVAASRDAQGKPLPAEPSTRIHLEQRPSIVARVARERQPIVVPDVKTSPDYISLSNLPEINAEAVIPLAVGEQTMGVLDVYSTDPARFTPEVVNALTIVANQTAIAVQNARLFADVRRARQEAEVANKAKTQFLSAMSHELRTPMNAVLNFTQFVSSGMLGEVNDKQKDALTKASNRGEDLLNLINDVLDISKIESDALQLYIERDIAISDIVDAVHSTAEGLLTDDAVTFVLECADDLPNILGDKQRIRQILVNLVSNACKFTKAGTVTLQVQKADTDHVKFIVIDTGPGIHPDDQERIFELFSQTKVGLRKGGGTGLGLPIARRLAEAHEGTLTVESDVDKGATFTLTLPIKPAALEKTLLKQEAED